jgi:hypothetical protein
MPATYRPSHFTRNLKFLYGSKRVLRTGGMTPPMIGAGPTSVARGADVDSVFVRMPGDLDPWNAPRR